MRCYPASAIILGMKTIVGAVLLLASFSLTSCISMIHRSVDRGDIEGIRQELQAGVSPEATDYRNKTPLIMAAEQGKMDLVEFLVLEAGANVNATALPEQGEVTALRYAIGNDDYQMVRFLINNGAEVNLANSRGWTPIMTAARVGNRDIMELLIENGADIRVRDNDGQTPLRVASNNGWTDIVVWLTLLLEQPQQ